MLPWLEHALKMRRQGERLGERLITDAARETLLHALRGLSAEAGPSGVLAAKMSALLSRQATPSPAPRRRAGPGSGSRGPGSQPGRPSPPFASPIVLPLTGLPL